MLKIEFNAQTRPDKMAYFAIYSAMCVGGAGQQRPFEVQLMEATFIAKLKAIGAVPVDVDVEKMPFDAAVPMELAASGTLLLEERERQMAIAYIKDARWPANLSEMRLAAITKLLNAEQVTG